MSGFLGRGNFANVSESGQCLVFLTFNSNVSSTLLPTFVLTYIIILANFGKESKNDMDKLYVKKPTNGYVGKRKEQEYE